MKLSHAAQSKLDNEMAVLKPYLVEPREVLCVKGGFEIQAIILAAHGKNAFFAVPSTDHFGAGTTNEYGDIVESHHYPNLTMAVRSFLGAVEAPGPG
ncbi:MAG: hypothetical protein JNJ55_07380 [Betaproteobacteria bacterium]|nr:hypothetical protein [Betaproteobacteria bacterium]